MARLPVLLSAMRPAYLTPKLTAAHRVEIRRLRAENPKVWTLAALAGKYGVHRSTIAHALRRRARLSVEQEMEGARLAVETSGKIDTGELLRLKVQEWNRQLLGESDLVRQQQLVNLLKSAAPMLKELPAGDGGGQTAKDEDEAAFRAWEAQNRGGSRHAYERAIREERMRVALQGLNLGAEAEVMPGL